MTAFFLRRFFGLILTLLGISIIVFWVMNILPGDPAITILGIDSSPAVQAALREELGLNAPVWLRYIHWLVGLLHGDLGVSYSFKVPVVGLIVQRLPLTLSLAIGASFLTLITSLFLGVAAAANHRRIGDWGIMMFSQLGIGIPAFWLSILLVMLFAVHLHWLPSGGFPGWSAPLDAIKSLILPTIALTIVQSAVLGRVTRSAVLEACDLDFVRTARSLGLSRRRILWRHILPNALVPIVTIAGLQIAGLITGTIVIENVFSLPGLGRLVLQAINNRDLFTVQALVFFFAAIVVVVNFIVDMLYIVIDPRLKEARA